MGAAPHIKTLAYKVIGAHPRLSGKAKTIGTLIIDHCNLETQRCDPGLERLSLRANCNERTTRRALVALDKLGLVHSQRHGGAHLTNAFRPNWELLSVLAKAFEAEEPEWWKIKGDISVAEHRTFLSKTPDNNAHQTLEGNLEDKTLEEGCPMRRSDDESSVLDLTRRRVLDDVHARCNGDSGRLKRLLGGTPRDWREAVAAELQRPGDGLRILEERQSHR